MTDDQASQQRSPVTVVVGVDGAGRTHRLDEIAASTAAPAVRMTPHAGAIPDLQARLDDAAATGSIVLVDDAHRLGGEVLRTLAAAARHGVPMAIARRPTIDRAELAELDEAVAAQGPIELLEPLDAEGVAGLVAKVTGRPAKPETAAAVREASGGLPAVVAAIAGGPSGAPSASPSPPGTPPPALVARVQRRLAMLDTAGATVARTLALQLELTDDVLAGAATLELPQLARVMRTLRDEGLLVPGDERMIPAVATAVLAELSPAERRRIHDGVAEALMAAGADPVVAAGQLRASRARSPRAAEVYLAAGERLRFADPGAALNWLDDAADAGADPAALVAGRAEAAALLGLPVDVEGALPESPDDAARLALVDGAIAAHEGRAERAAEALLTAGPVGSVLAVPALVAIGRYEEARAAAAGRGAPLGLQRLAEAALASRDPGTALPLLIEAAETVERTPPAVVLPDTPHALGALAGAMAGDTASAEHLLDRALATGIGGAVAKDRHRLLLAWVRMRAGRYDTAIAEIRRLDKMRLPGRERLLLAAVAAGIARRSGDIARLRDTWAGVEQVLARRAVDLFQLEAVEELVVAAARLRQRQRIAPVVDALGQIVERLGRPDAWAVAIEWVRLQVAIAGEDPVGAASAARHLSELAPGGARQQAQCAAGSRWADALAGNVDAAAVLAAADDLAAAELPWEASRLAGQSAIRTTDPGAARRLLEHARELSSAEPAPADTRPEAQLGGLSEREVEVARLVLAGRTHREIGAQLYISPKTVEHHVARIRTKLGATTRAEFVAALRAALGDEALP
jgi:DNA-binding CsgD family transcriptional regulator